MPQTVVTTTQIVPNTPGFGLVFPSMHASDDGIKVQSHLYHAFLMLAMAM
jgi:hypothetical protein